MHNRLLRILALAVCLGLLPGAAYAKGGKGGGPPSDKGKSSEHGAQDRDKHHGEDEDRDEGHSGHGHGHGHQSTAAAGPSNRPHGWDEGKKVGWGDCDVPPGLAKKRGCDSGGLSIRERSVRSAQKRGFGDCAVSESEARKRGCDSRGLSTRERAAERQRLATRTTTTTTHRTVTATGGAATSKTSKPGQTRTIILQRDAANKQAVQK